VATVPLFAAFEAHVINVTAHIENALWVSPEAIEFGTVFPQEYLKKIAFVRLSESFMADDQIRVGIVDYVINQKPKPRPEFEIEIGISEARTWCHDNGPSDAGNPNDSYYDDCYPSLCPYLSKTVDAFPFDNDTGVLAFHNPGVQAVGRLEKFTAPFPDDGDYWTIDLAVPCFEGYCAQDWATFVTGINPNADPAEFILPKEMEHETFGCDLWFEVTGISAPVD